MIRFDPRTLGTPVYEALSELSYKYHQDETRLKEQKNQALELYSYLSTWGMMRLKAEEKVLSQPGKKQVIQKYFECLQHLSGIQNLADDRGLVVLKNLRTHEYLGLTGLGLALANEFSFWATAVYQDISRGEL